MTANVSFYLIAILTLRVKKSFVTKECPEMSWGMRSS